MSQTVRLLGALILVLLALLVTARLAADGFAAVDLDVGTWPQTWRALDQAQREEEELLPKMEAVRERRQVKRALAADLAAGRLGLAEAVARFREMGRGVPYFVETLRTYEPGASDEERLCRHVIDWVRNELAWEQARWAAVAARLEGEMRVYLRR
jgi:hypothetical protein